METFQLTTTSISRYIRIWILVIISYFLIVIADIYFYREVNIYVLLGFFVSIIVAYWLADKYSRQDITLSLKSNYIQIEWDGTEKAITEILWSDIDNYVFQEGKFFCIFKLNLSNGESFRIFVHRKSMHHETLEEFYSQLLKEIEQYSGQGRYNIKQGKTFYETMLGKGLAFLLATIMIGTFSYSWVFEKNVKWFKLISISTICVFYIQRVIRYNLRDDEPDS